MDISASAPHPTRRHLLGVATLLAVLAGTLIPLLGPSSPTAASGPHAEPAPGVAIPGTGPATPWPASTGDVRRGHQLTDLRVVLHGVQHACVKDLDIVLRHGDRRTTLLSDVGEQSLSVGCHDVFITRLTIDDSCPAFPTPLPVELRSAPGGELCARPTDVDGPGHEGDELPGLGATEAGQLLDVFRPVSAVGPWDLFVHDDATPASAGRVAGWEAHVTTSDRSPQAASARIEAHKGEPVALPLRATDPEDGAASCIALSGADKGTATGEGCSWRYVADAGAAGSDQVRYRAADTAGNVSPEAVVTIDIVNRPPTATPVDVSVVVGGRVDLDVGGSDPDAGDTIHCGTVQGADLGRVEGRDCDRTYVAGPTPGVDDMTYLVADGAGGEAPGTVRVTVVSDAPTATPLEVLAPKGAPGTAIALTGTEPTGGYYTCEVDTHTAQRKGTLTGSGCHRTFTPDPGTGGTDTFTYRVRNDRGVVSAPATVTITIPNRSPQTTNAIIPAPLGERTDVHLPFTDPDGDPLTCTILGPPVLGRFEGTGCRRTYVAGSEVGTDTIVVRATDGAGGTLESSFQVRVEDVRPQAQPRSASARKGEPVTVELADAWTSCQVAATSAQGKGTVSAAGCRATYTAAARASGTDTFTYTVRDAQGRTSAPATVTITIQNRAPATTRRAITVLPGDSAAVALGGTDPDPGEGAALTCTPVTGPTAAGRVGGSGCFATYVAGPTPGTDIIVYSVQDPFGATATGIVDVTIAGDAPAGCTTSDGQDARYVCRAYTDLLGRPADAAGKAYWVGRLARGESRAAIIKAFTGTSEYRTSVVRGIWRAYLGTTPDATTTQRWVTQLGRGANPDLVRQEVLASPEFHLRAGATPEGFVAGLHQQLLRRPATASEIATLAGQIRAGTSRATVVTRLLAGTGADTTTVAAVYERFLRRSPPQAETDYWVGRLQRGESELALVRMIVASPEYHGRA